MMAFVHLTIIIIIVVVVVVLVVVIVITTTTTRKTAQISGRSAPTFFHFRSIQSKCLVVLVEGGELWATKRY